MPDHDIDGRLKQSPSLPVKKASLLGLDLSLRGRFTIHLEAMKLFSGNIGWGVLFFYFFTLLVLLQLMVLLLGRRLHIHLESQYL